MLKEIGGVTSIEDEDRLEILLLDCSNLANIREFGRQWKESGGKRIDYLFLNAGIIDRPRTSKRFTEEGFELI
jgi:NAD(P)-dependent dehydrogenase (short-subunit alcohol dehydrogenase family)